MATMNPAMVQHPLNLKLTIIISQGTEPRVLHSVISVARHRFQLDGMKNIMQMPGRRKGQKQRPPVQAPRKGQPITMLAYKST